MRRLSMPSPALVVACIALLVALGPAVRAANTVFSTDIGGGEVKTADIGFRAINSYKLGKNAVNTIHVWDNTLTGNDLKGANVDAVISLAAGAVANGRCVERTLAAAGASIGEAVLVSQRQLA